VSKRFPSQPDELLRRWGTQVVPVDTAERAEQRRAQVVDALSRSIRQNAERKLQASRVRWLAGLGLAAAVALGLGVALHAKSRVQDTAQAATTVAELQGAVVVSESGQSRVLSHGSSLTLHAVGEIETAADAQAEIHSPKSLVHLGPATKLTVPQSTRVEERYRLALGRVDVSVDKDSKITRSVVVETPNAEVVVHGTVFAVGVSSRAEHTVTDVSVTRGSVWVLANGAQVAVLGPGQRWSSENQPAPLPPASPVAAQPPPAETAPAPVESPVRTPRREPTPAEVKASALAEQGHMFQDAIDARNRGDDPRAVELFTRLVARYPSYEEAEVQLFRAQKRLGQTAAAAAVARRYLAQHPQGFAHEEARSLALSAAAQQPR
jgi:ferric-dicitrate binding protein FerR (iron transport regulator)